MLYSKTEKQPPRTPSNNVAFSVRVVFHVFRNRMATATKLLQENFSGIIFNMTNSQESKLKFGAIGELKMVQALSTVSMN